MDVVAINLDVNCSSYLVCYPERGSKSDPFHISHLKRELDFKCRVNAPNYTLHDDAFRVCVLSRTHYTRHI